MVALSTRDLMAFPLGDNSSDTLIADTHFNVTTLEFWNYTLYSNNTLSNGSNCYLAFEPYVPILRFENGTFFNSTSCFSVILPMKGRAITGLIFFLLFAASIGATTANLHKHAHIHSVPRTRHHRLERRSQWYLMFVVAGLAMLSNFAAIDVDRYYLTEWPIILTSISWYLLLPFYMALMWETVRHWGQWQKRQMEDTAPGPLHGGDRVESWLAFGSWFCFLANTLVAVAHDWSNLEKQRDPVQTSTYAQPTATDICFKAAAFILLINWLIVVFSLHHSIQHYCLKNRGIFARNQKFLQHTPWMFGLTIPLSGATVAYNILCSFDFSVSLLKVDTNLKVMYGWGWGSVALVMLVLEIAGYFRPNEDLDLIRQRIERGDDDPDRGAITTEAMEMFNVRSQGGSTRKKHSPFDDVPSGDRIFPTSGRIFPMGARARGTPLLLNP